jgi:hypothetical protein
MITSIKVWALAALVSTSMFSLPVSAQVPKTAKACDEEYASQKSALKANSETKRDFMAACRALPAGQPTPVGDTTPAPSTSGSKPSPTNPTTAPSQTKTTAACDQEYKTNKAALKAAKQSKKDFVKTCIALPAGQPTPIGSATAPVQPTPAPQRTTQSPSGAPAAPMPPATTPRAQPAPGPSGANRFPSEASAKARCPGATVVWVNAQSKIYHFAGTKNYGNTKAGSYMCESDASTEGDRASKTEHHP